MSTLIVNPNDTIALSDAIVVKVADVCQPMVQEPETSCNDVTIVAIICATIVLVALIAMFSFLIWKCREHKAEAESKEKEREKDEKDRQWKQRSDLIDKKLDFLKGQVMTKDKDGKTIYDDTKGQAYIAALDGFISKKEISE